MGQRALQQCPSHFSIMTSRIFDSMATLVAGRHPVAGHDVVPWKFVPWLWWPPKYAAGIVASEVFGARTAVPVPLSAAASSSSRIVTEGS